MFLHSCKQRLGHLLRGFWVAIGRRLPTRCKRICLLISLYAKLVGCTEDDLVRLRAANEMLHLSRDENALRFPTLISPWIWGQRSLRVPRDENRKAVFIERLVKIAPCWLKYADDETLKADVRQVVNISCVVNSRTPVAG